MRRIDNPSAVTRWNYHDQRLGRGFMGTRDHIIVQVQTAYLAADIEFREKEIPALIDNYMCEQGFAAPCTDRIDGLGDVVERMARPVMSVLSAVTGQATKPCSGCKARQEWLNRQVPL